ncbi:glycosyltransferase family 2 protein [Sinomonas humi]|uniref:glycosyltransferase family 2 protein n=1 Tax=Sinomonas humi TaxID=1338436 RepID=UPI0009DDAA72|nr:glycosyltransferase family 2 protein [Sinomonas humi]
MSCRIRAPRSTQPGKRIGRPTATVVIPCHNYGRYLPQAALSALGQEGVEVEVIVVDDASTDQSLDVASQLCARYPGVKVLANSTNCGPVATFNKGLAAATGEFLVRLDADDLLTPGSIARAITVFDAFPSVGLVYGHPLHFTEMNLPPARTRPKQWTVWSGKEWLRDRCISGLNVITSPEVVMRMSTVHHAGPQMPLRHTHDMEMWLRLAAFGDVAFLHGVDQAWHREHPASLSATEVTELIDLRGRAEAFDVLFSGPVGEMPELMALRESSSRALAEESVERAIREYDVGRGRSFESLAYQALAEDLVTDVSTIRNWNRLEAYRRRGTSPAGFSADALVRRLRRRVRTKASERRWRRDGVFTPGLGPRMARLGIAGRES